MAEDLDILSAAVPLLVRAALLAARLSGRVRKRSLKRLAARDADAKAREILFLKDRVYQLEMQVSILQKHLHKKGKSPRYAVLLILRHMEAFQIPRRKVSRYFGVARSALYRWLQKIEDQTPSNTPANKTPMDIAALVWESANFSKTDHRLPSSSRMNTVKVPARCHSDPTSHLFRRAFTADSVATRRSDGRSGGATVWERT